MSAKTYTVGNWAMVTTAAPTKQPTGTAIRTMLQLLFNVPGRVVEWGYSFDAASAGGVLELIDTSTVGATGLTNYYATSDIEPDNDPNAPAQTSGTSGIPFGLSSSGAYSGFNSGAPGAEGSITGTRSLDTQQSYNEVKYFKQLPMGRESEIPVGHFLRVRVTMTTGLNALCYVKIEI